MGVRDHGESPREIHTKAICILFEDIPPARAASGAREWTMGPYPGLPRYARSPGATIPRPSGPGTASRRRQWHPNLTNPQPVHPEIFVQACIKYSNCILNMPRKIRELIRDYRRAGARIQSGRGSHRRIVHTKFPGCVILSGGNSDDARHYQKKDLRTFLKIIKK